MSARTASVDERPRRARASSASFTIAGCTCTKSAISDGTRRGSSSAAPGKPGRTVVQRSHAVEEVRDDARPASAAASAPS